MEDKRVAPTGATNTTDDADKQRKKSLVGLQQQEGKEAAMADDDVSVAPCRFEETAANMATQGKSLVGLQQQEDEGATVDDGVSVASRWFEETAADMATQSIDHEEETAEKGTRMDHDGAKKTKTNKKSLVHLQQKEMAANLPVESRLLSDMATQMSVTDKQSIRKRCESLLAKIASEEQRVLPMEEVMKIVKDWKPKEEVLCLYIRIARKLPANFHLDSISTLLCIAKQCGFTPAGFLTKAKSLQIKPAWNGKHGFAFSFNTVKNKHVDGDTIDRKLVGLSLTLTLLEHTVSNSCGVISRNGMRSSTPREPINKALDIGGSSNTSSKTTVSFKTMPSHEFHTRNSLIHRLWLAINHRWMAFHLVQNLFEDCADNHPADQAEQPSENDAILMYSFMMHAACGKSRYDFLDPMAGICFRFKTKEDIAANLPRLKALWKNPSDFLSFGNTCLQRDSEERKIGILVETFGEVKKKFPRVSSYGRSIESDRRWLLLRGYVFFHWLKRDSVRGIRSQVESRLKTQHMAVESARGGSRKETTTATATTTTTVLASPKKLVGLPRRRGRREQREEDNVTNPGDEGGLLLNAKRQRLLHAEPPPPRPTTTLMNSRLWSPPSAPAPEERGDCPSFVPGATVEEALQLEPNDCLAQTKSIILSQDWTSIRLMTQSEMDKVMASYLLVHTDDSHGGLDILLKLSPIEVYSADKLKDFRHCRLSGPPGYLPLQKVGDVVLQIGPGCDEYLDKYSKLMHVARQRSTYFNEHKKILPSDQMFANVCRSILTHGIVDSQRSKSQYRVNIGCGGQHFPHGIPAVLVGKGFAKKLDADEEFNTTEILSSIGLLVEFLWCVAQDMQRDASDAALAPDHVRREAYAKHLREYLGISRDDVGFEDITLVISPITSREWDIVAEHTDVMNDNVGGYSRTCVFSTCFSLNCNVYVHMQVIGNFRRVIRQYMVPFAKSLESTILNSKRYIDSWQLDMQSIYAGVSCNRIWDAFDRSEFFLDDALPFKKLQIFDGTSTGDKTVSLYGDYLLTEIGLSRVTSFSMFIDPINKLKDKLCTDQRIELVFFACLQSNPFWFYHVMQRLSNQSLLCFGDHPMYDVVRELYATFGTWQGGPHNRWSPCGGAVPVVQVFGAHPSATSEDRERGMGKLEAIIRVLFGHLEWVNSLKGRGADPLNDLPLSLIHVQWERIRKQVHEIVPCQFSLFRLSVFTTIVIGCNVLASGPHLKQLFIPFPGTSSYKHLLAPSKGLMSRQSAADLADNRRREVIVQANEDDRVTNGDHDRLMLYLSNSLGRKKYVRDEMECLLCESHPGRNLDCRDWFCKGQDIFDCRDDGTVMFRSYGKRSNWEPMGLPEIWSFKFLEQNLATDNNSPATEDELTDDEAQVYYKVDKTLALYALSFGDELRHSNERIVFNGRQGTRMRQEQRSEHYDNPFRQGVHARKGGNKRSLTIHHYRSANMFSRDDYNAAISIMEQQRKKPTKMLVLGNGERPKDPCTESNAFESFQNGPSLLKRVRDILDDLQHERRKNNHDGRNDNGGMMAGCYHQEVDDHGGGLDSRVTTYFPGHRDKHSISRVQFIPLSHKQFFTFLAVPSSWKIQQDSDSNQEYQSWLNVMSEDERKLLENFQRLFERDACKSMKLASVSSLVFSNKLGSILQFPSNLCFHATVIPGELEETKMASTTERRKSYRDLLICHRLITMA